MGRTYLETNMTWTTEKPTKSGWYWWRRRGDPFVLSVVEIEGQLFANGASVEELTDHDGEWSGPLEEPAE